MEIIRSYRQSIPAVRFIGKKYGDSDRVDGSYGARWMDWFDHGWFDIVEQAAGGREALRSLYEDGTAPLGYMRYKDGAPFEYWIGMFTPPGTDVPEGFLSIDLEATEVGICWYKGKENEIYAQEHLAMERLQAEGMEIQNDEHGYTNFFERYSDDRFLDQDEQGTKILDIGFVVKPA